MSEILSSCEEYFGSRDIYEVFSVAKDADLKEIKKAYYNLSLKVHPDRVPEEQKLLANEKFKILSKLYQVLSNEEERAIYDEHGTVHDDNSALASWLEIWRNLFKPLEIADIENYQKNYIGSTLERSDIKKAYLQGEGCINFIFNNVPFITVADEERLQTIVKKMIDDNEVPEYTIFTEEPEKKRNRRRIKHEREFKKAEEIKAKMASQPQTARNPNFSSLLDNLLQKYVDKDDTVAGIAKKVNKKMPKKAVKASTTTPNKDVLHEIKGGKVRKRNA